MKKTISCFLCLIILLCAVPLVVATDSVVQVDSAARDAFLSIVDDRPVMALVYLSDIYTVRQKPSLDSAAVADVPSGQTVLLVDVAYDEYYNTWYKAEFGRNDVVYTGYIMRTNLACSDERFLGWERDYNIQATAPGGARMRSFSAAAESAEPSVPADIAVFPVDYQASLIALKNAHPNWQFVKMETGLEWSAVMKGQMEGARSLVHQSSPEWMKRAVYGQGWWYASEAAVAYYLDPRNWINKDTIFMFELLTYNETYHTEAAVQTILNNTFMSGVIPLDEPNNRTYARVFFEVGAQLKVSPFHLASRVRQEQGVNGTSPLISGTYKGYEGLYNYFNVAASGSNDTQVITNGLIRARNEGWTTPYKSIEGGARFVSTNYILRGQDTVYLQKFDVDDKFDGLYWHQYMQNIVAPVSESKQILNLYVNAKALENTFVFKIPVYKNMPGSTVVTQQIADEVTLPFPIGFSESNTKIFLDGKEFTATTTNTEKNAIEVNDTDVQASTAVMYKYDKNGVPEDMYVWIVSKNSEGKYITTPVPELQNLLTYHGFSIRITGQTGIRVKTGIATGNRTSLTSSSGLAGFKLKEYGTLVMTKENYDTLPLIKDGTKTAKGIAYGTDSNGKKIDAIFESVNGRYRFTSVLTGLPPDQYKTEFVFRGYIILTKSGADYTIYGPPVSRSIYSLAEQLLNSKTYPVGSETDKFLRKLIADAK